jgi:hypothetical protein
VDTAGSVSWYRRSLYFIEAIRTFAQGFFGISFVVEVHIAGMSALAVGMVTTLSVSIGIVITRYIEVVIPRYGTRVAFLGIGVLMIATGSIMSFLPGEIGIALAALFGFLPPLGGQFSAAVAEGALAQTPAFGRTKVFALYGLVATVAGASGSLFASLPVLLGANTSQAASILILLLVPLGVLVVIVGFSMPRTNPLFDAGSKKEVSEPPPALDVRKRLVYRLALLFTADSIGSGVVTPTLVLYWLHVYFNLSLVDMSLLYFGMDILSAISFPLAERISRKIGLLNTAVFTHIPSSLLLIAVPFAPNGLVAAMLLLGRSLLVEMDVPTRQSYIASIVPNSMRAFAASRTSIGKQTGRAIGPAIGGTLFSSVATVAPFLTGGVLKICYDVALWSSFRQIKASPSEE